MRLFDSNPFAYFSSEKVVLQFTEQFYSEYGGDLKDSYPLTFFISEWIVSSIAHQSVCFYHRFKEFGIPKVYPSVS